MYRSLFRLSVSLAAASVLASCSFGSGGSTPAGSGSTMSTGSSVSSAPVVMPTHNVSYLGTVEELGVSVYQEGTHKLVLGDGQFILLSSTDGNLSLNTYLGKRVEVRGSVRPTVEGGSVIMHVEEVTLLDVAASSASSSASSTKMCGGIAAFPCDDGETCIDNPDDSCDPDSGGADCGGICVPDSSSSSSVAMASSVASSSSSKKSSSAATVSSSKSSVASVPTVSSSSSVSANDAAMEATIVLMAKQNYEGSLWTQKYCTSHIAFCIPVHKNWYYKSFGATTNNQWHVEFSMSDITGLYQGPIVMNLVSGSSSAMNASDGEIRVQGSEIIGFKDWNGGHFEFIADARLREPVAYMIAQISAYTPGD